LLRRSASELAIFSRESRTEVSIPRPLMVSKLSSLQTPSSFYGRIGSIRARHSRERASDRISQLGVYVHAILDQPLRNWNASPGPIRAVPDDSRMPTLPARLSPAGSHTPTERPAPPVPILSRKFGTASLCPGTQLRKSRRAVLPSKRLFQTRFTVSDVSGHGPCALGPLEVWRLRQRRSRPPPNDALHMPVFQIA
jgi:hypothetical protein